MPDTALQASLDPLGIWAASPETAVAFSVGEVSAPVRRIALPESLDEAQSVLAANARAVALTRQHLARAAQELALIGPPEQVSFSAADELFAQKNALASTIDELRSPVSFGIKLRGDPDEQETHRGWLGFVEQVRQAVMNAARVSTELGSAPIGLTTVSWQGDFETTWALGVGPGEMQVHLDAVQAAMDSRLEMVRTVSVVATGVANILLKATIPGAQLMLLPAVYKFVRDVLQQLRK
jgi:hypothetical protein